MFQVFSKHLMQIFNVNTHKALLDSESSCKVPHNTALTSTLKIIMNRFSFHYFSFQSAFRWL